jgi:hypothetical protein
MEKEGDGRQPSGEVRKEILLLRGLVAPLCVSDLSFFASVPRDTP